MFAAPMRLISRVLILVTTIVVVIATSVTQASAAPMLEGKATVVGSAVARGKIKLASDFGIVKSTGTFLFNTEVRSNSGKKISQWTETLYVKKGQRFVRNYTWDTAKVVDGRYTVSLGIAKPNWKGTLAWKDNAGVINLAASPWALSATSNFSIDQTGPVEVKSRFVSPTTALGTYTLKTSIYDATGAELKEWSQSKAITGAKTTNLTNTIDHDDLGVGTFTVRMAVVSQDSAVSLAKRNPAGLIVIAPEPVVVEPTTTTVAPTTTTTAAPTTTTAAPTTTTAAPITTTTVAPTTTTMAAPTTTTVVPTTTTQAPTTTMPTTTSTTTPSTTTTSTTSIPTTTTTSSTTLPPSTTTTSPVTIPSKSVDDVPVATDGDVPAYNAGWQLVFNDDFTGTALNRSTWATYDGRGNEGVGYRSSANVSVGDGEATLKGTVANLTGSGMCYCGKGRLVQTYGRYEIRARMDAGNGFGPALLLWPDSEVWPGDGEIDIAEMPKGDRTSSYFTVHYGSNNSQISTGSKADFTQWHTFGVEWVPDHITYFLDGVAVKTFTGPTAAIPTKPMHLALQNDAGAVGHWISAPDANSPAQINLHIDWVKIYK